MPAGWRLDRPGVARDLESRAPRRRPGPRCLSYDTCVAPLLWKPKSVNAGGAWQATQSPTPPVEVSASDAVGPAGSARKIRSRELFGSEAEPLVVVLELQDPGVVEPLWRGHGVERRAQAARESPPAFARLGLPRQPVQDQEPIEWRAHEATASIPEVCERPHVVRHQACHRVQDLVISHRRHVEPVLRGQATSLREAMIGMSRSGGDAGGVADRDVAGARVGDDAAPLTSARTPEPAARVIRAPATGHHDLKLNPLSVSFRGLYQPGRVKGDFSRFMAPSRPSAGPGACPAPRGPWSPDPRA